jgi:hypothetical protein
MSHYAQNATATVSPRRADVPRAIETDRRAFTSADVELIDRSWSAISTAERMDIGHGPDKCVPVDWLVLMAASV